MREGTHRAGAADVDVVGQAADLVSHAVGDVRACRQPRAAASDTHFKKRSVAWRAQARAAGSQELSRQRPHSSRSARTCGRARVRAQHHAALVRHRHDSGLQPRVRRNASQADVYTRHALPSTPPRLRHPTNAAQRPPSRSADMVTEGRGVWPVRKLFEASSLVAHTWSTHLLSLAELSLQLFVSTWRSAVSPALC